MTPGQGPVVMPPASSTAQQPAPAQAIAESLATSGLPALDRTDRPPQMPGRLLVRASLQVAKNDGRPVPFGQLLDLLVKPRLGIVAIHVALLLSGRGCAPFVPPPVLPIWMLVPPTPVTKGLDAG